MDLLSRHIVLGAPRCSTLNRFGRRRELLANELLDSVKEQAGAEAGALAPRFEELAQSRGLAAVIKTYTGWTNDRQYGFSDDEIVAGDGAPQPRETAFFGQTKSAMISAAALVLLGHCLDEQFQEAAWYLCHRFGQNVGVGPPPRVRPAWDPSL